MHIYEDILEYVGMLYIFIYIVANEILYVNDNTPFPFVIKKLILTVHLNK